MRQPHTKPAGQAAWDPGSPRLAGGASYTIAHLDHRGWPAAFSLRRCLIAKWSATT